MVLTSFGVFVTDAPQFLNSEGKLILEIGCNQSHPVQELMKSQPAYKHCEIIKDYAGIERVVLASI